MKGLDAPKGRRRLLSRLGALAAIMIAGAIAIAVARRREPADREAGPAAEAGHGGNVSDRGPLGRSARPAADPAADRAGKTTAPLVSGQVEAQRSERDEAVMNEWRAAIGRRDPDAVEALNRVFLAQPSEFTGALMSSAESDADERVRAFSTRVLGKLRAPATAELLRKLLGDGSPYVRQNAAWGLGQLADRSAASLLQRSATSDPDPAVRESARDALRNIDRAGGR